MRAWLYCRVANGWDSDASDHLALQKTELEHFCTEHDLTIVGTSMTTGSGENELKTLVQNGIEQDSFDVLLTVSTSRLRLTAQRNKKLHGLQSHSAMEKLEELQAILSSWPGVPTEFDIDQFDEIVEKIIPTADNKLTFRLHCGLELTEEIPS